MTPATKAGVPADDRFARRPGEKTSDYFARLAGICADAAELATLRDDKVSIAFFLTKAAEFIQAAKAFQTIEQLGSPPA